MPRIPKYHIIKSCKIQTESPEMRYMTECDRLTGRNPIFVRRSDQVEVDLGIITNDFKSLVKRLKRAGINMDDVATIIKEGD